MLVAKASKVDTGFYGGIKKIPEHSKNQKSKEKKRDH